MIGLTLILIFIVYIFIAYKVAKFVANNTNKKLYWMATLMFFILLPTWDIILGKFYFNYLCKTEGGLKVYQKNIRADGFLDTSQKAHFYKDKLWGLSQEEAKKLLNYGFKFYEVKADNGKIVHFYKENNGSIVYDLLDKPKSRYKYKYQGAHYISYLLGIYSNEQYIKDINNHVIVEFISFYRMGWLSKLIDICLGGVKSESCYRHYSFTYQNDFKQKLLTGDFHE